MKVGEKTNLGDLPQYFKFVRWMLTSSLKIGFKKMTDSCCDVEHFRNSFTKRAKPCLFNIRGAALTMSKLCLPHQLWFSYASNEDS